VPGPAEIIHTSSDAGWQHCTNCGNGELFNNSNSCDSDPQHAIGAAPVDGGPETTVELVVPDQVDVTN